jgi:hypothetical protein
VQKSIKRVFSIPKLQNFKTQVKADAEEAVFRTQLMAKFAEDDRIEQLNEQKRRMKVQVHRREVERLIEVRGFYRFGAGAQARGRAADRGEEMVYRLLTYIIN